jgi:very-short-patch-repair endonuclease
VGDQKVHTRARKLWRLTKRQHGVVAHWQLEELGYTAKAVKHRVARGRLHRVHVGVYAVGRPDLTQEGRWMAAVLACGPEAWLSHESAAAHFGIARRHAGAIHVSVPYSRRPRHPGIKVHRRRSLTTSDTGIHQGIPVTSIVCTLVDIAAKHGQDYIEGAVNEADKLDLIDPEALRAALDEIDWHRPGVAKLRETLDIRTFTMSDSELERRFKPIARRAGLGLPKMGRRVNGFKVDFFWPDLGLVIETDGLRYHRTPAQQTRDRIRDQTHTAAGLTPLRFTRAQVRYEPDRVLHVLRAVVRRLNTTSLAADTK